MTTSAHGRIIDVRLVGEWLKKAASRRHCGRNARSSAFSYKRLPDESEADHAGRLAKQIKDRRAFLVHDRSKSRLSLGIVRSMRELTDVVI